MILFNRSAGVAGSTFYGSAGVAGSTFYGSAGVAGSKQFNILKRYVFYIKVFLIFLKKQKHSIIKINLK